MRLTELDEAIAAKHWERALDGALVVWRSARHPLVADVVEGLAGRVVTTPVFARGDEDAVAHAKWLARAKNARPVDVTPLLGTLLRALPRPRLASEQHAAWLARLAALSRLPADPRIASTCLAIALRAPLTAGWTKESRDRVYAPAFREVVRNGDARILERMIAALHEPRDTRQAVRRYLVETLPPAIAELERTTASVRPLPEDERAHLAAMLAALGGGERTRAPSRASRDEETLLRMVLEDLGSDAPRAVLADHWLESGDPRGELVTLQLMLARGEGGAAERKAVRALVREHGASLLGGLLQVAQPSYDRGFLHAIELRQNASAEPAAWEAAALSPALATVARISKGKANETHYRRFVFSPAASALDELTVLSKAMLRDVCARAEPWTIRHLELAFAPDRASLDSIRDATVFPRLDRLTIAARRGGVDRVIALTADLVAQRPLRSVALRPLAWYDEREGQVAWLRALDGPLAGVTEVELAYGRGNRIVARRAGLGQGTTEIELFGRALYYLEPLVAGLRDVARIVLRVPDDGEPDVLPVTEETLDALDPLRPLVIELDPAWTAALEGRDGVDTARAKRRR